MHGIVHEITAAIGGILFIIIGVARQKERLRLISTGKKTEGSILWTSLVIAGVFLVIFALGLMVYQLSHP
ncbi:MAG: hypothetical protein ACHQHN_14465 [Sphingobacteriales bacterium]